MKTKGRENLRGLLSICYLIFSFLKCGSFTGLSTSLSMRLSKHIEEDGFGQEGIPLRRQESLRLPWCTSSIASPWFSGRNQPVCYQVHDLSQCSFLENLEKEGRVFLHLFLFLILDQRPIRKSPATTLHTHSCLMKSRTYWLSRVYCIDSQEP